MSAITQNRMGLLLRRGLPTRHIRGLRRNNQAGFTIIEIMIAAMVLAIGMGSVFSLYSANLAVLKESRSRAYAIQLAMEQLEHARMLPFKDVNSTKLVKIRKSTGVWETKATVDEAEAAKVIYFEVESVVAEMSDHDGRNRLKKVTTTVSWNANKTTKTVQMQTMVTENGLNNYVNQLANFN